MLVLTRRVSQKIRIGDDILVTIASINGSQVKVGVEAPRHISVHREEVYQRVLASREEPVVAAGCGE